MGEFQTPIVQQSIRFMAPGTVCIESAAVPTPGPGEVFIRTRRTLISTGTELTLYGSNGNAGAAWAEFARFPRSVGYSHVGQIVELGQNVDPVWMGQMVASRGPHSSCVVRPVSDLRRVPPGVSHEAAAFATLAGVVMNGLRRIHFTWGESVAVFGLGLVGQLAVRIASAAGAGQIFGMDVSSRRLEKLPQLPWVTGINTTVRDLRAAAAEHGAAAGVDVAIEASGDASLIPREISVLRDQGRLLILSSPREPTPFDFHDLCNRRSIQIVGAHGFSQPAIATPDCPWTASRHGDLFLDWVATGRLSTAELVTHRFPFSRAPETYAWLAANRQEALGVIFEWD
jgi:threonine dehydrogenase-like Zn-dependent dehydrogenase